MLQAHIMKGPKPVDDRPFFERLISAPLYLFSLIHCPYCEKITSEDCYWTCGDCEKANECAHRGKVKYSPLQRCGWCNKRPRAMECYYCGKTFGIGGGNSSYPARLTLSKYPDTVYPQMERKEAKEQLDHDKGMRAGNRYIERCNMEYEVEQTGARIAHKRWSEEQQREIDRVWSTARLEDQRDDARHYQVREEVKRKAEFSANLQLLRHRRKEIREMLESKVQKPPEVKRQLQRDENEIDDLLTAAKQLYGKGQEEINKIRESEARGEISPEGADLLRGTVEDRVKNAVNRYTSVQGKQSGDGGDEIDVS